MMYEPCEQVILLERKRSSNPPPNEPSLVIVNIIMCKTTQSSNWVILQSENCSKCQLVNLSTLNSIVQYQYSLIVKS